MILVVNTVTQNEQNIVLSVWNKSYLNHYRDKLNHSLCFIIITSEVISLVDSAALREEEGSRLNSTESLLKSHDVFLFFEEQTKMYSSLLKFVPHAASRWFTWEPAASGAIIAPFTRTVLTGKLLLIEQDLFKNICYGKNLWQFTGKL